MFRVNQKVVCVDAAPRGYDRHVLRKGAIYSIRAFGHASCGGTGIFLNEVAAISPYGFWADRFRPVVDTDISIFTAMLNPSLEDLRAIVRENANA